MRISIYSQELTDEVIAVEKKSNTGRVYRAAQLILHSSEHLHHPPQDDDRSAVTFWMPRSSYRNRDMAAAFRRIADLFDLECVEADKREKFERDQLYPPAAKETT